MASVSVSLVNGRLTEKKGKLMNNKTYPESNYKCGICGEEYTANPSYCDETLECALDEGESLIAV